MASSIITSFISVHYTGTQESRNQEEDRHKKEGSSQGEDYHEEEYRHKEEGHTQELLPRNKCSVTTPLVNLPSCPTH